MWNKELVTLIKKEMEKHEKESSFISAASIELLAFRAVARLRWEGI